VIFRKWKHWLLNVAIVITIFLIVSAWQSRDLVSEQKPAPTFQLSTISGSNINLEDLQGKPVLIYFFAPWCKICDLSISNLNWVRKIRGEEYLTILAVALSYNNIKSIESFLERNTIEIPVLLGTPEILNLFHVSAFPTIYTINESGKINSSTVGYTTILGLLWRTY